MAKLRTILTMTAFTLVAPAVAVSLAPAPALAAGGGLMSIIVNDPSNPYWLTEGNVAAAEAKKLGYKARCQRIEGRHQH